MNEAREKAWERFGARNPIVFEGKTETQIDIIKLVYTLAWNDGASYVNQNIIDEIKEVKHGL